MLHTDVKFAKLLTPSLAKWKLTSERPFGGNFRCPICGDSKKHESKARGYFYENKNVVFFKCHNCQVSMSIKSFLRRQSPILYDEYLLETVDPRRDDEVRKTARALESDITKIVRPNYTKSELKTLKKISQLRHDHPAKRYIEQRKIPNRMHGLLYYCPKFFTWTNTIIPHKFKHVGEEDFKDEPRLIIPFINGQGVMFAFQGRSFDPNCEDRYRYFTIVIDRDEARIYGFDRVNFDKRVYVLEGPIDSMFIDNAVAMASSATSYNFAKDSTTYVYDNEPRNPEIVKGMKRKIANGYSVCIQDGDVDQKHDINDMAIAGMSSKQLKEYIDNNTYTGLEAELKLAEWRKC